MHHPTSIFAEIRENLEKCLQKSLQNFRFSRQFCDFSKHLQTELACQDHDSAHSIAKLAKGRQCGVLWGLTARGYW